MYIYIYLYIFIEKEKECFSLFLSPFALFSSFCCFLSRRVLFDTQKKKKEKLRGECGGLCVSGRVFFFFKYFTGCPVLFCSSFLFFFTLLYKFLFLFTFLDKMGAFGGLLNFFFLSPGWEMSFTACKVGVFFFSTLISFALFSLLFAYK